VVVWHGGVAFFALFPVPLVVAWVELVTNKVLIVDSDANIAMLLA
jgi:hypothetical protein